MSDMESAVDAEQRPYELAVERYLVDRLTALLRDPPRMSEQEIRARAIEASARVLAGDVAVPDVAEAVTSLAERLAVFIRSGEGRA